MGCFRILLALICPPLAVLDLGCSAFFIVLGLTFCGYVPGVIAAFACCYLDYYDRTH